MAAEKKDLIRETIQQSNRDLGEGYLDVGITLHDGKRHSGVLSDSDDYNYVLLEKKHGKKILINRRFIVTIDFRL